MTDTENFRERGVIANKPSSFFRIWRQSRFGFSVLQVVALLAALFVLRLILFFEFYSEKASWGEVFQAFLIGAHLDLAVACCQVLPLLFWFALFPERWFASRAHRIVFAVVGLFLWSLQIFLLFTEYYFFEEFKSRYNTVAIDYLIYPHEVFVNIRESYPLKTVIGISCGSALILFFLSQKLVPGIWQTRFTAKTKWLSFSITTLIAIGMAASTSFHEAHFSSQRALNEIANNGSISFLTAAWSRNLEYDAFYLTIPRDEAYQRTRKLLSEPNEEFSGGGDSILRRVHGDKNRPRLNVVLFLEESLGSEFWGSLGRKETVTPQLDKLAAEGMLFENMYATGNRTVRGFEGILSSFPPLPGDSIVKRDRSQNVETIARVLKRDGYATEFLYGGRGIFDGMRSFALNNGYDKFVEQKDFAKPTFTTAWGVCDEDLYQRTLADLRELSAKGEPFLATILSVSNHKPYTYPTGRIPEDPRQQRRENAVKYTDWALGQFFEAAKKESFWTNTLFVVVADHGARVYGSQTIPIHSYEIPLLFLGPAFVKSPARVAQLGCQLDVVPTILGLLDRPYDTLFFGRNILRTPEENAFVLLNHNRDIGLFRDNRLVVLNLNKGVEFFHGNPKTEEMRRAQPDARDLELQHDATALFQVADDLYMNRRYHLDR